MTRATNALRIFYSRQLHCPITDFLLTEGHIMQLSQSNENASFTSLHASYICYAVEPLLIFGMSSNDVTISPESLSTRLTEMGKSLSSSSLLPSTANPCQGVNNSSSFRPVVIYFETW